ncbi:ABC transporter substrate-binding protein [Hydrogenophaga palleronii]|uniref:ABC transporter substrate-binding protein n=1 Tax=Hydrogenophaga palleronii TaxID=65655 RepID=UPI000A04E301|nr:ABC transporter substrate-binding protein [Hydrogenophaga palleronii]
MTWTNRTKAILAVTALVVVQAPLSAQTRGVSDKEIRIGTLLDLSGPLASSGKDTREGMQMRVGEINAQGGIGGRMLKLHFEDHGYDPKKAVLATQKLLELDGIFAMVGQMGTAMMLASAPLLAQKDAVNFMPLSATALAYQPPQPLVFAYMPSYIDQLATVMPPFLKQVSAKKVCVIYQDDEFGQEILRGTEAGLKAASQTLVEHVSYKRGATDFSSQVARTAAAGCDAVVLGTVIRETVGVMTEARKIGYRPAFVSTVTAYSATVPKLGGDSVEGLYATVIVDQPYVDSGGAELRAWAQRYKLAYKDDPSVFAAHGYFVIDSFIKAARAAGPQLTTASFVKALETTRLPPTLFGTPEMSFSPTKRIGIDAIRMARIKDGRWISAE